MSSSLTDRLNQILPRVTSEKFLSSQGIGKEIACYIFHYPAQEELVVRDHIAMMMKRFQTHHSELHVLHVNLLDAVVEYLKKRGLYEKTLKMEEQKGNRAFMRALRGPLSAERLRDFIAAENDLKGSDLLIMSGVGSVWPILHAHTLLNCMHTVMGMTPLVMFYPGRFDGTTLRIFGGIDTTPSEVGTEPYYRALILIPGGEEP